MQRLVLGFVLAGFMVLPSLVVTAPASGTVPGENGRLVYVDQVDSQVPGITAGEIYTMNPDGSDVRRLTNDAGRWTDRPGASDVVVSSNWGPKWSPDGLFIAYVHLDEWENYSIRLMDADGAFIRTITDEFRPAWSLSWSPDGSQLALDGVHTTGGEAGIWLITEAGTNPRLLIPEPDGDGSGLRGLDSPEWSPIGDEVAFSAGDAPGHRGIYTIEPDGTNLRHIPCGYDWSWEPEWNAEGSFLFCSVHDGHTDDIDIWVADVDGGTTAVSVTQPGIQTGATAAPADNDLIFKSSFGASRTLMSAAQGFITEFEGDSVDWQPVQRIAHSVGLVDPVTGKWYLTSLHGMVYSFYYGNPGDYPIMGDWDCTGTDTPGLYRQSDGYVYLRNSNTQGNADVRFYFGNPGDIPIAGDFNGDGCDTVSLYRQSEGRVYIINQLGANDGGLGAADYDYYFGNPGDKPFVGDFDGDGISTVGLHRESTGLVYFRNTNTQGIAEFEFYFGNPGDRLVAGDWSYDGMDTPAVFRPTDRTFYLRYTNTQGNADEQFTWGQSRWLPVTGYFGPP